MDEFVTELRQLSKNCGFTDLDKEILSQVIQHCSSSRFRRRALREPNKSLTEILDIGRTLELTDKHAASMENESISAVRYSKKQQTKQRYTLANHKETAQDLDPKKTCNNCGGAYPHSGPCPALGKTCNYCKKQNHFKRVCMKLKRKEPINRVQEQAPPIDPEVSDSSSEDEYCYGVRFDDDVIKFVNEKIPTTSVKLNNVKCQMTIDTGASVNIIDKTLYKRLGQPTLKKKQLTKRLYPYGRDQPFRVLGRCDLLVETSKSHEFYVVPGDHGSLLGYSTSLALNLIAVLNKITDSHLQHETLFKGIGKLKDTTVKLHIDETVKPVAQKQRRTPFHLRDKVANEIEKLLKEDVIEKVEDTPTPLRRLTRNDAIWTGPLNKKMHLYNSSSP